MKETIDPHQLEKDLESVCHLPNLESIHGFIGSLPYQDKYVFILKLNQALISLILLQKHTRKCMWMLMDVHSHHGFPIEIGWSQVAQLDDYLKDEWMWNEMKRKCAFILVDDEFKETLRKIKEEVQNISIQLQTQVEIKPYDRLIEKIKRQML
eukprot:jgi/Antlo1/2194/971